MKNEKLYFADVPMKNFIDSGEMEFIREVIKAPTMYEGIAEEAVELAHAALKVSRILRGDNPTPVSLAQAMESVSEELSDSALISSYAYLSPDISTMLEKHKRFMQRLEEKQGYDNDETCEKNTSFNRD